MSINNSYFLVTGSSSGLGESICKTLDKQGLKFLGIDIDEGNYTNLKIDLSKITTKDIDQIKNITNDIGINSIIHCAAQQKFPGNNLKDIEEVFNEVFSVNVKSIYILIKLLEDNFLNNSSVCIVSSVHSKATTENNTLYASSKSAITGLVKGLTIEQKSKMSIFEVVLGAMDSPMLLNSISKKEISNLEKKLPSEKILEVDEVGNLILDLLNNHRHILHGSSISIDNGVLSQLSTN